MSDPTSVLHSYLTASAQEFPEGSNVLAHIRLEGIADVPLVVENLWSCMLVFCGLVFYQHCNLNLWMFASF